MKIQEYIFFCDESDIKGKYYSNFYGGALVSAQQYIRIVNIIEKTKMDLNLFGEVKWSKVTERYLDKYILLMDCFFREIQEGNIKIRIMFRKENDENAYYSSDQIDQQYFKLYYQFMKHAFKITDIPESPVQLRFYFDQFPQTKTKIEEFKKYVSNISSILGRNDIVMAKEDIVEVKSHEHVILQCLDVILGSICFRLNKKHLEKQQGQSIRGKRTIAKEKLYNHIQKNISTIHPNFNVGISTAKSKSGWNSPYAHWNFIPKDKKN